MKYKVSIGICWLCLALLTGCGSRALGQSNNYRPPPLPCVLFNPSPNIFIGKVIGMKADDSVKEEQDFLLIEFLVRESFVGSIYSGPAVLRVSAYSADYLGIAAGKLFLVYAGNAETGKIPGVDATATKPADKAGAELTFLRHLNHKRPGAWIYGSADLVARSSLYKDSRQRLPSVYLRIRLDAENKSFEVVTDANGNYLIEGLAPGRYRVSVKLPDGTNLVSEERQVTLVNNGCSEENVDVRCVNKISGKVVDTGGNPIGKVPLELIPFDYIKPRYDVYHHEESTGSNDDGSFTFSNVQPGKYLLAVNYTILPEYESPFPTRFYPGTLERTKAKTVEIEAGKDIDSLRFVLGPERLVEKMITGRVVFPDGSPAPNIQVYLKEDQNQECCVLKDAKTDPQGNFTLVGFVSRKYRIWTFIDRKPFSGSPNLIGASSVFTLDKATPAFQIALRPTTKGSLDAIDEIEMRERGKLK